MKDPEGALSDLPDHDTNDKEHEARDKCEDHFELDVDPTLRMGPEDVSGKDDDILDWIRRCCKIRQPGTILWALVIRKDASGRGIRKVKETVEVLPGRVLFLLGHGGGDG